MHRIAKLFLVATGILLFLYGAILLCVNLYLQSEGVQSRIAAGAGNALGMPVAVRGTSYTPWSGLSLSGIAIPNASNPGAPLLNASSVSVKFSLWPLLQGRLVVREVLVDSPTVIWQQPAQNQWRLPVPALARQQGFPSPPPGINLPAPDISNISVEDALRLEKPPTKWIVEVNHFRVRHASITITDPVGHELLHVEQGNIDVDIHPDKTAEGYVWINKSVIRQLLYPQNICSHFTWQDNVLTFPDVTAVLDDGTISGTFATFLGIPKQFTTDLQIANVSLFHLADDLGIGSDSIEGTMNGEIKLAGDPTRIDTLNGKSRLTLNQARFKPMDFIQQIGSLLQIDELQILQLKTAEIDLTAEGLDVNINDATLKSQNLVLEGKGVVRLNGGLDIKARLLINGKIQSQVGRWLGDGFINSEFPEYKQLPFIIDGKINHPHTDLMDKLVGEKINVNLNGLFKNLFAKPQQRSPQHPPAPTPASTPVPAAP